MTDATLVRRAAIHDALAKLTPEHVAAHAVLAAASLGLVIDVAWVDPTVAQLRALGAVGVIGYLSYDTSKNLSAGQIQAYTAAGIHVGTVWETTAGRALAGRAAGVDDARAAEGMRKDRGLPGSWFHRAAVDTDTSWPSVAQYFAGWASVVGKDRIAPYGGVRVVAGAYAAGYRRCWQTLAWSQGRVDPHAVLYQSGGTLLSGQADINHILSPDWGQYPPLEAPVSTSSPLSDADALLVARAFANLTLGRTETTVAQALLEAAASAPTVSLTDAQVQQIAAAVVPLLAPVLAKDIGDLLAQRLAS